LEAREFYDYLLHRILVRFAPKLGDENENNTFDLTLSKRMTYDQLAAKVGEKLGVDPTFLRFSPVNVANGRPKPAIRHTTASYLGQLLSPSYSAYGSATQRPDALYYEVLEVSMSELETRKSLKVTWLPDGLNKEVSSLSTKFGLHMTNLNRKPTKF
jgi:ubiquitin carboxyl-terminal hydrolase 7